MYHPGNQIYEATLLRPITVEGTFELGFEREYDRIWSKVSEGNCSLCYRLNNTLQHTLSKLLKNSYLFHGL